MLHTLDNSLEIQSLGSIFKKVGAVLAPVAIAGGAMVTTFCTGGLDTLKTATLLSTIATLYRTWSIPFMLICAVLWALTKDEKKKEVEKRVLIGLVIVYIITYVYDAFQPTFDTIGASLKGE